MAGDNVTTLTDETFDETIKNSPTPVLVDFWAPWCGPCRAIAPIIEELATQYAGKLKVCKVNVDDDQMAAQTLNVQSIPLVALFKGGQMVERIVGAHQKRAYEDAIAKVV